MNRTAAVVIGIVSAILLFAFAIAATWLGWWPVVLDIVLIIAALTTTVLIAFLILAVIDLTRTIREIRAEVMPVLDSLRTTSTAVRETAKAATSFGVSPAVRTAGFVVGATSLASVIFGQGKARKRSQERQKRRQEYEREMARRGEFNGR
jgi:hypothetical protein